jgi:hypothetical protein
MHNKVTILRFSLIELTLNYFFVLLQNAETANLSVNTICVPFVVTNLNVFNANGDCHLIRLKRAHLSAELVTANNKMARGELLWMASSLNTISRPQNSTVTLNYSCKTMRKRS